MSDNVTLPGTGEIVHADEFTDSTYGAGKSQQFKLADGTPGSSNKAIVGSNGALSVAEATFSTATVSSVNDSASSVTLLSNTSGRKGGYFFNNSDQAAYVKLGTTATVADFTIKMAAYSYYELPQPVYTGRIDAIWAANSTGAMLCSELT